MVFFRDTFKSIVHDTEQLSLIQKFHYVRLSLKGEAAEVFNSLEVSDDNYNIAWELLVERYKNKSLLMNNHVKALYNLPT